jgi:hypothetical protein
LSRSLPVDAVSGQKRLDQLAKRRTSEGGGGASEYVLRTRLARRNVMTEANALTLTHRHFEQFLIDFTLRTARARGSSPRANTLSSRNIIICRGLAFRFSTSSGWDRLPAGQLGEAEALRHVGVDHPDGLHEALTDRRADEPEPATLEFLAHRV